MFGNLLSRYLNVYKEDYFQINAYPDFNCGSVREIPLININESY